MLHTNHEVDHDVEQLIIEIDRRIDKHRDFSDYCFPIIEEFAVDRRLDDQILRRLAIPVNDQGLIVSNALYEELFQPGA